MLTHVAALTVALVVVSGCGREERPTTARGAAPRAAPAVSASRSISEQLAAEAASRPSGTVTVEEVVAALQAFGDPVLDQRQVLATPVDARYCALLDTRSGLVLSVCEFESPPAAQSGLDVSRSRFDRLIPGRRFALNGSTLLTVTPGEGGETASDPSGSTRQLFAALSPRIQEGNEK